MLPQLDAAPTPGGHPADARSVVSWGVVAVACGVAFGVLLGSWCRAFADTSSVNGVLANLATPWVGAAFFLGVIVSRQPGEPDRRVGRPVPAALAGAIAGTICLVVATIVYYGPARTGSLDFGGAVLRTAFWIVAGIVAGVVFGAAGAVFRTASSPRLRATCAVVLGAVVVGELGFVVLVGATNYDAMVLAVLRDAI